MSEELKPLQQMETAALSAGTVGYQNRIAELERQLGEANERANTAESFNTNSYEHGTRMSKELAASQQRVRVLEAVLGAALPFVKVSDHAAAEDIYREGLAALSGQTKEKTSAFQRKLDMIATEANEIQERGRLGTPTEGGSVSCHHSRLTANCDGCLVRKLRNELAASQERVRVLESASNCATFTEVANHRQEFELFKDLSNELSETKAALEKALKDNEQWKELLTDLVTRLDYVHNHDNYKAVWSMYMIHGGNYTEPKYEKEFEAAKQAIDAAMRAK